jgi:Flp pilus assembly protein TadD
MTSLVRIFFCGLVILSSSTLLAAQAPLDRVMLQPTDLPPDCQGISGEYPVDTQSAIFFEYPDYQKQLLPPLQEKRAQSLDCGGAKGTIYYFAYSTAKDVERVTNFVKPLMWGEAGPSPRHPQLVITGGNVLGIVSFRKTPAALENAIRQKLETSGSVSGAPPRAIEQSGLPIAPDEIPSDAAFKQGARDFTTGNFKGAEKNFRKSAEANPKNAMAHFFVGEALFRQQKFKEAVAPYAVAAGLEAEQKRMSLSAQRVLNDQLGMAYGISGDLKKAEAHFSAAIEQDPDYALYRYNLACTYAEMNNLDKTLVALEEALKRKDQMIAGESFPDPRRDDSFQRFVGNARFKSLLAKYGY